MDGGDNQGGEASRGAWWWRHQEETSEGGEESRASSSTSVGDLLHDRHPCLLHHQFPIASLCLTNGGTVASEFCPLNSHEAGLRIMKKPETGTINSLNLLVALPIMQIMFVRRRQQQGLCLRSTKSRTIFMTCKGSQNHSTSCQRQVSHNPAIISTSLEHLT
jgi:hypothetical protein